MPRAFSYVHVNGELKAKLSPAKGFRARFLTGFRDFRQIHGRNPTHNEHSRVVRERATMGGICHPKVIIELEFRSDSNGGRDFDETRGVRAA